MGLIVCVVLFFSLYFALLLLLRGGKGVKCLAWRQSIRCCRACSSLNRTCFAFTSASLHAWSALIIAKMPQLPKRGSCCCVSFWVTVIVSVGLVW